ncbi:hypothetical protein [Streptomyces sp. NPDC055692]|uniref:hypothetical protein n=1 Tax=Streptomyces sp. NPDC055692 TaxID=3155683 RepID=UPI003422A501
MFMHAIDVMIDVMTSELEAVGLQARGWAAGRAGTTGSSGGWSIGSCWRPKRLVDVLEGEITDYLSGIFRAPQGRWALAVSRWRCGGGRMV